MNGFFRHLPTVEVARKRVPHSPECPKCGLCNQKLKSPKMKLYGSGEQGILIVGQAPGAEEDLQGVPFIGPAGQYLRKALRDIGAGDLERDCWVTNSIICRSWEAGRKGRRNRTPTSKEITFCRPNVVNIIHECKPKVIIPLGKEAVESVIGWLWKENVGPVGRWVGWQIPYQKLNSWICPTWHPSYMMRNEDARNYPVLRMFFLKHLEAAFKKKDRPWKEVPDYKKQVRVVIDPDEAAWMITDLTERAELAAFDYETVCLKPDGPDARIYSCSMSDGETTFSYPWLGKAVKATQEFLRSPVKKVASNLKFESRFSLAVLKTRVRNWAWDTMLAAHVLDNRSLITSIKFQAFCLLGADSWDDHIKPYLKARGGNTLNRIKEVNLHDLLYYNALDSLYELLVAKIQAKQLGVEL